MQNDVFIIYRYQYRDSFVIICRCFRHACKAQGSSPIGSVFPSIGQGLPLESKLFSMMVRSRRSTTSESSTIPLRWTSLWQTGCVQSFAASRSPGPLPKQLWASSWSWCNWHPLLLPSMRRRCAAECCRAFFQGLSFWGVAFRTASFPNWGLGFGKLWLHIVLGPSFHTNWNLAQGAAHLAARSSQHSHMRWAFVTWDRKAKNAHSLFSTGMPRLNDANYLLLLCSILPGHGHPPAGDTLHFCLAMADGARGWSLRPAMG